MRSGTVRGIDGVPVEVMAKVIEGLDGVRFEGLADVTAREVRVRVQAAIVNSGVDFPKGRVDVKLDAGVGGRVDGTGFDLPIALAVLGVDAPGLAAIGELSLNGEVRPVRCVLPIVEALQAVGVRGVLVAQENVAEAELVPGVTVYSCANLRHAITCASAMQHVDDEQTVEPRGPMMDIEDLPIDPRVVERMEAYVSARRNVLLVGTPGAGKTMLARRVTGMMPGMRMAEAMEVTRICSVAGMNVGGSLVTDRPFRAPHHSTSPAGLTGGGASTPRPGEVTLAHNGVMYLDEVTDFARAALENLREPIRTGAVELARASGTVRYPARCMIIASAMPCPCGRRGSASRTYVCRCDAKTIERHDARLAEICAMFNMVRLDVPEVDVAAMDDNKRKRMSSREIRLRVAAAWSGDLVDRQIEDERRAAWREYL